MQCSRPRSKRNPESSASSFRARACDKQPAPFSFPMLRRFPFFALSFSLIFLAAGCAKKEMPSATATATPTPPARKILHYGNAAEPQDIDPQTVSGAPEHRLIQAFFEGLVSEDPQLNITPGVAEK